MNGFGRRNRFLGRRRSRRRHPGRLKRILAISLALLVLAGLAILAGFLVQDRQGNKNTGATMESSRKVALETMPPSGAAAKGKAAGAVEKPSFSKGAGVDQVLASMTLEEKVLQMFVITPEALTGVERAFSAGKATQDAIKEYPVGGLVYFSGNLESPDQVKKMLENVKTYSKDRIGVTMFTCVDEEGGTVARVANNPGFHVPKLPDMAQIGKTGDVKKAYEAGSQIGTYLSQLGFNVDFAPVADVLTNPDNQVVRRRAFGTEGEKVAGFVVEDMKGLEAHGVKAVLKHFPGHGATAGDTHNGYAFTNKGLGELLTNELIPFQAGIQNGVDFIMVSHIAAPSIIGDDTPSSLSKTMVTNVLRNNLGYKGIVITDSLSMEAITKNYGPAQAAVKAIQAGDDMLLMPKDFKAAYQGVVKAVRAGQIPEERIDQSLRRILSVKEGLDKGN